VKAELLGAMALGYVFGTRAGRERYDQIRQLASEAAERLEAYGSGGTLARWLDQGLPAGDARPGRS
jgi:hypothetical protein